MTHLAPGPPGEFPLAPMRAAPAWEKRPAPPKESAAAQASAAHARKPDLKAEKRLSAFQGACVGAGCVVAAGLVGFVVYALVTEAKLKRAAATRQSGGAPGARPGAPGQSGPFADLADPLRGT